MPTPEQNAGQSIRVLSARRIVMAFDPATGNPDLLRTVVMLLRTASITAAGRSGANEIATAEEKLTEALGLLTKIDDIQKTVTSIHKSAAKIHLECDRHPAAAQPGVCGPRRGGDHCRHHRRSRGSARERRRPCAQSVCNQPTSDDVPGR